uniref:F-actin-capping protein subunit alpha n=1 Tax=Bursaphelenchus xylophilus TaxID=6326 RepID=A0A1I7S497_BURXY
MAEEFVSDAEKGKIASELIQEAPPGEFNEVWNDVRVLLNDDKLMGTCSRAAAQYHKDQLLPIALETDQSKTLLTNYNEISEGRFFDPNTKTSFKFDFLSKTASDIQPYEQPNVDEKLENFRKAVQTELNHYLQEHYHNIGTGVVFIFNGHLAIAIESHIFQAKNYWNGRWRSQWEVPALEKKQGNVQINGIARINVHYYEDGNVQLSTKKNLAGEAKYSLNVADTAKNVVNAIHEAETSFESAVLQNYTVMSDSTFKTLRRKLPITRSKFDWNNAQSYRLAQDINRN